MIKVYLNNEEVETGSANSLDRFLSEMNLQGYGGMAVALNNVVVPKSQWEKQQLQNDDKIIVIRATAGG